MISPSEFALSFWRDAARRYLEQCNREVPKEDIELGAEMRRWAKHLAWIADQLDPKIDDDL